MLDSIWLRSEWEISMFFAFGTALATTVCARAALRLSVDRPRRRPTLFGAEVGAFLGVAICAYLWASSNPRFDEIDGAALSVWEKANLAGFPTTKVLTACFGNSCGFWTGVAFIAQTTVWGALWGKLMLCRVLQLSEQTGAKVKKQEDDKV